jgi:heme exporter protein C
MKEASISAIRNLSVLVGATMLLGLAGIFLWVPTEDFQGVVQRIFYVHVPSAWISYLAYTVVLIGSIAYLRTGSQRWDLLAHSSAEVGVVFTSITLVSGMLWARPVWGAYWVWDPRLTLTLVLFLIYVGYLVVRTVSESSRSGRIAAVIGIAGYAVVPLVHFSVEWWRGHHPARTVVNPSEGPQLPPEMLAMMLYMLGVFTLLFVLLLLVRIRLGRSQDALERLKAGA